MMGNSNRSLHVAQARGIGRAERLRAPGMMGSMGFNIAGDPAADRVLDESPFGLLIAMLLDQQYPMEHAFRGPAKVLERFGSHRARARSRTPTPRSSPRCARPRRPSTASPGRWRRGCRRWPRIVVDKYDGHAERLWNEAADGRS